MNLESEIKVIQCKWLVVQQLMLSPFGFPECHTICKELDTLGAQIRRLYVSIQTQFGFDSRWILALFFQMVQFLHPREAFFLKHVSSKWHKFLDSSLLRHYLHDFPLDIDWIDCEFAIHQLPSGLILKSAKPHALFYAHYQYQEIKQVMECKTDLFMIKDNGNDKESALAFAFWNPTHKQFVTYVNDRVVSRWTWKDCKQGNNVKWCLHKGWIYALYENELYCFDGTGKCVKKTHATTTEMVNFTIAQDQDQFLYAVGTSNEASEIVIIQVHLDTFLRIREFWLPFCFRPNSIAI